MENIMTSYVLSYRGNDMRKYYESLYDVFYGNGLDCNNDEALSFFVPLVGSKYTTCTDGCGSELRLMVIGRAVNGWNKMDVQNKKEFISAIQTQFNNNSFEEGVYEENGKLCFNPDYTLTRSAFWRTSRRIWVELSGKNEVRWVDNIVWSNIYKVSPSISGNPTPQMCKKQQSICKELLKKEIEFFKPTHILLVTDWNWIADYEENSFLSVFATYEKADGKYVAGTAWYECYDRYKIPVVITYRPDKRERGRTETIFVNDVLECFRKLKE